MNKGRKNWLIYLQTKVHELSQKVSVLEQTNLILFEDFYQKKLDEYVFKSQEEAMDFLTRNKTIEKGYQFPRCDYGHLIVKVNDRYESYYANSKQQSGRCSIEKTSDSTLNSFNTEGKIGFAMSYKTPSTSGSGYLHGTLAYVISPTFKILRQKYLMKSDFKESKPYQSTIHNLESNDHWEADNYSTLITPKGMLENQ